MWPALLAMVDVANLGAAGAAAATQQAPVVAIVDAGKAGATPEALRYAIDQLAHDIAERGTTRLPASATLRHVLEAGAEDRAHAEQLVDRAQRAYERFDYARALRSLHAAEHILRHAGPAAAAAEALTEVHRSMLLVHAADGNQQLAVEAATVLLQLRPEQPLDAGRFPPPALTALDRAKQRRAAAGASSLRVLSDPPGATVQVDGVMRGETPLLVDDLSPGVHYLRVERPGSAGWGDRVVTVANSERLWHTTLAPAGQLAMARDLIEALRESSDPAVTHDLVTRLSAILQVDAWLVLTVRRQPRGTNLESRLYLTHEARWLPPVNTPLLARKGLSRAALAQHLEPLALVEAQQRESLARPFTATSPRSSGLPPRPRAQPEAPRAARGPVEALPLTGATIAPGGATQPPAAPPAEPSWYTNGWLWTGVAAAVIVAGAAAVWLLRDDAGQQLICCTLTPPPATGLAADRALRRSGAR